MLAMLSFEESICKAGDAVVGIALLLARRDRALSLNESQRGVGHARKEGRT